MSNEIKVGDKVRVRKDAPIIYYYSSNGIVADTGDYESHWGSEGADISIRCRPIP